MDDKLVPLRVSDETPELILRQAIERAAHLKAHSVYIALIGEDDICYQLSTPIAPSHWASIVQLCQLKTTEAFQAMIEE